MNSCFLFSYTSTLHHSGALVHVQMRRRVKQVPLAFYKATPSSLFSECDFPGWTFKHEASDTEMPKHINDDAPEMKAVSEKRRRIECS